MKATTTSDIQEGKRRPITAEPPAPIFHKFAVEVKGEKTYVSVTFESAGGQVEAVRRVTKDIDLVDPVKLSPASSHQVAETVDCERPAGNATVPAEQVARTVVHEEPAERIPDPVVPAEKIVEQEFAARMPAGHEDRVEQPVNFDYQAAQAPELQPQSGSMVNLDWSASQPVEVDQRIPKQVILRDNEPPQNIQRSYADPVPTAREVRVEPSVNFDRQTEKVPEHRPEAGRTVNPEGPRSRPLDDEPRARKQILLIEDDPTILMLLEMCLRTHDFDCVIAENGKAAQGLLQTSRPDIIMVDLFMPVMDGLAFIQWLRQTAHDSTPILVFSTVDDPKIIREVLRSGADHFARKPLHPKELVETLNKLACSPRRASMASSA